MEESLCPRCGKKFIFKTPQEAEKFLLTPRAIDLGLVRTYRCGNIFHVTSRRRTGGSPSKFYNLELELHREMATIKEWLIDYMSTAYKERNVVEFAPAELRQKFTKSRPSSNPDSIHTAIYQLKKDGIVVDLKKNVIPGKKGNFITLAMILEKETEPMSKKPTPTVPAQPTKEEPKKPSPATLSANPFDKVNAQLQELLTKVNGLAQGYSELAQRTSVHSVEISGTAALAEAVNNRLTDLVDENSLIYRIREEVSTITDAESKWIVENISVPEGVSNQDDYRAGLKEGIRLATELSLTIRED